MQVQAIIQDMEYLRCPTHKEELSIVCLQRNCSSKMLLCLLCEETHSQHSTIPLKQYLKDLTLKPQQTSFSQLLSANQKINTIHKNIKLQLQSIRYKINNQILQLQSNIELYFNQMANKLLEVYRYKEPQFISNYILRLNNGIVDPFAMASVLQNCQIHRQFSLSQALNHYISDNEFKLSQLRQSLNKFNHQVQIQKAKSYFLTINKPFCKVSYKWSQFRSSKILVKDNIATQSGSMSNGERFALLQPEYKQAARGKIRVGFKILKLKGWIGVGICLRQIIIKGGYKFNYTLPLHGSYLVSANGFSWSHSQPEFNSSCKSFTFGEGDIVFVEYNNKEKTVTFDSSKEGVSKFVLNTVQAGLDDDYTPCVNLCNPGDEVELINS